jgi:hypothetical protein
VESLDEETMIDAADSSIPPSERFDHTARILRALREAVREALLDHKRTGDPVAIWQDGHVVWVQPEDIAVPDATVE